ncbi:hypothetical protein [Actinoplanes sp. NPDC051859]|uniref:hypothetical protein n=1 Tax=Actinoplanes sp. NPDC051859 TaxID=3363909 RepID=UPI0037A9020A
MNTATDLVLIGALAAAWLAAGLLVDVLPGSRTARVLRRRTRTLSMVVGAGVAMFLAVPVVTVVQPGDSPVPTAAVLPAVPALVVLIVTARRLTQVRRGVRAFTTAPLAPAPPALVAAAAHPLLAAPLQVTGLAAVLAVVVVAGVEVPGRTGGALTAAAVILIALATRHAVRHSRLSVAALTPLAGDRSPSESVEAFPGSTTPVTQPVLAGREVDLVG